MYFALISLLLVAAVNGAKWDGLRVTWAFDKWGFNSMPRDVASAGSDFSLRDIQCASNSKVLGHRYWYKADPALNLLYDKNGIIAGIQTSVPKTLYTPSTYMKGSNFVDDGNYWSLTAYFVEPRSICSTGRTLQQLQTEGTGTGLWLQVGSNPLTDTIKIPMTESAMLETDWKFGKCFQTMGNHYWFNVTRSLSCEKFIPNCMLYNGGQLTAFCFAINANLPSVRYEHPTNTDAEGFMNPVPDCFYVDPSFKLLSTLHVYMVDDAKTSSRC